MSGWTTNVLTGLAEELQALGIGVWNPTGAYADDEIGIFIRAIPTSPDRVIILSMYPVSNISGLADVTDAIQIRVRGDEHPNTCDDIADAIYDEISGSGHRMWGGRDINQIYRQSFANLGQDTNRRWERSENYYVDAMRPTSNNTD